MKKGEEEEEWSEKTGEQAGGLREGRGQIGGGRMYNAEKETFVLYRRNHSHYCTHAPMGRAVQTLAL